MKKDIIKLSNTQAIAFSGFFVALGLVLPFAFHGFGENSGKIFMPIYIVIALSSLILPLGYSLCVAVLTPVVSSLLTSMPAIPLLYFMIFELVVYALMIGLLKNKLNSFLTVGISIVVARICYVLSVVGMAKFFGFKAPFANINALLTILTLGITGVIIQIILCPLLYEAVYVRRFSKCKEK